ncbi:MAG: HAD family hydrolase [Bacteroidales bacterium]|jgi:putative hydrolase of the HAD superfamily|nr:HAD family hydrolase [Bacteroidales bacterium]
MEKIKVIGFDADDTLWINEPYYQEVEIKLQTLLENFLPAEKISGELFRTEMSNLHIYGYGAKSFMLSMIETALKIGGNDLSPNIINEIILLGKSLLEKPVELLDNVKELLPELKDKYSIIVATKGDLVDQQRKLNNSGLVDHFDHIEIMKDKQEKDYIDLIRKLNIKNEEFLMIGNSLMSDVLPVVSIGGKAIHIPYHTTWIHEIADKNSITKDYIEISKLSELKDILL